MLLLRALLFSGTMLLFLNQGMSQNERVMSGFIFDENGVSLPGSVIHIHENMKACYSDEHGYFKLTDLKPGRYHLHITSLGYHAKVLRIDLVEGNVNLKIEMEVSTNELHEITVEASGYEDEKKESSLMIERSDRKKLMENPSGNLMNSMQQIAGINSINTGVGVGKPVIRGLSQNRVLVTEGGIKQEGQQWGNDHGLEINQYNIEGVEIIKGASSLAYGSDAMGGVINIQKAEILPTGSSKSFVSTIYKSNNDHYGLTAGSKGTRHGYFFGANISAHSFGDYRVPADEFSYNNNLLPINEGRLKNTGGRELHYSLLAGIQKNWVLSEIKFSGFNQKVGVFPGAVGIPRSINLDHDGDFRNIDLPYQDISHHKLLWNSTLYTRRGWFESDLAFQQNLRYEYSVPHAHGRPLEFSDNLAHLLDLKTYSGNFKYRWHKSEKLDLTIGSQSSYLENSIGGFEFIIPPYQQLNTGLFGLFKYRLSKKSVLTGGLRYDLSRFRIESSVLDFYYQGRFIDQVVRNPEIDKLFGNYSGAIGLNMNYWKNTHLRINFGKTFRVPNVAELSSNGVHHGAFRYEKGDENLKPEEGYQFDFGIDLEKGPIYFDLALFSNYFDNYIYLSPKGEFPIIEINDTIYPYPGPGQLYTYRQSPAMHLGGEFNLVYSVNNNLSFGMKGEYVWIENLKTGLPVSFTPPPSLKFEATYYPKIRPKALQKPYIKLIYSVYGEQNRVDQNEKVTPGYELLDFMTGTYFGRNQNFELNLSVQNLLDKYYLNHLSRYRLLNIPEPGINVVATLTYYFNRMEKVNK